MIICLLVLLLLVVVSVLLVVLLALVIAAPGVQDHVHEDDAVDHVAEVRRP